MTPTDDQAMRIEVRSSNGPYPVHIGSGLVSAAGRLLADSAPAARYAVVSDETVAGLHADALLDSIAEAGLSAELFTFPTGEVNKNRKSWSILTDALLDRGFGRDSCVVSLGGGVTGDLAGFVAATFLRGVPVVHFPTSYLAMIDASVGGKTGVDVRAGKNLVGAFHPPRFVAADLDTLDTLPRAERREGLVEALKHGAIRDEEYFGRLTGAIDALLGADRGAAEAAVSRSVALKADVVSQDEREGGVRQILNFGHTLGHALEAAADFGCGHGTAVAAGMVLESEIGERLGVTAPGTTASLEAARSDLGIDFGLLRSLEQERVLGFLSTDKKSRAGRVRYVLLERLGRVSPGDGWSHEVPSALVREVLRDWR